MPPEVYCQKKIGNIHKKTDVLKSLLNKVADSNTSVLEYLQDIFL